MPHKARSGRKRSGRRKRSSRWKGPTACPSWADDFGRDDFGAWAEIRFGDAVQRMRWIPPGSFLMGSPEDEEGRFGHEGPQHRVTFSRGFWMGDTPCTDLLFRAVLGDFRPPAPSPRHPAVFVSWDDCKRFLEASERMRPGSGLQLPGEAEWEFACRAGTTGARFGDLDVVAWHRGNSGGEPHPVAEKAPNALGLYDTLGNVYEWCEDPWAAYSHDDRIDPVARTEGRSQRVLRGGSWGSGAGGARAAFREASPPGDRGDVLGFRLFRDQ